MGAVLFGKTAQAVEYRSEAVCEDGSVYAGFVKYLPCLVCHLLPAALKFSSCLGRHKAVSHQSGGQLWVQSNPDSARPQQRSFENLYAALRQPTLRILPRRMVNITAQEKSINVLIRS
jgi:hypothetical protein